MTYEAALLTTHQHNFIDQQQQLPLFTARPRHVELAQAFAPKANPASVQPKAHSMLHTTTTTQKVQAHDGDSTLGSGSGSGSGFSDISGLENGTDTLGQQIMQHERDARRLRSALDAESRPLQLKTRARPRISELVERREREVAELAARQEQHDRLGSSGSNASDPPLNVPREWGTRARAHRGWMRKIREPSEPSIHLPEEDVVVPKQDEDAIVPHRTAYTGDDYHSPLGDDALPEAEMTPPSMTRARLKSEPAALRTANDQLRHIIDSEDQDFSELPLMESTPAASRTIQRLDYKTSREITNLERQRLASRTLDQLSERSPNNSLRRRRSRDSAIVPPAEPTVATDANDKRPTSAPSGSVRAGISRRKSLIGNKENLPINATGSSHFKGAETVTITDRTAQAVTFKQAQRPGHARQDSMKLLQRLARVSSMSPSPGRPSPPDAVMRTEKSSPGKRSEPANAGVNGAATGSTRDQVEKVDFARSNKPWPSSSGRQGAPSEEAEKTAEAGVTPAAHDVPPTKTPTVTGAWVDTPAGSDVDIRPLLQTTDSTILRAFGTPSAEAALGDEEQRGLGDASRRSNSEPSSNRARSALEDIVREARAQPNCPFGDATIQSLEDIVHPNLDATETTLTFDDGAAADAAGDFDSDGRELTQAEKDRRQEDLAIEAMNKHLRAARTSIKDADRGLRRVENRVELEHEHHPPGPSSAPAHTSQSGTTIQISPSRPATWRTECTHCGGSYRNVWSGLLSELLSTIYTPSSTARLGFELTWLGTLLLLFILYQFLERLLCHLYCHDFSAETMRGFGVDPDAPQYPLVIPTLVFRPLRPIWRPALHWAKEAWTASFHTVVGSEEGTKTKAVPRFMQPGFEITPKMIRWDSLTRNYHGVDVGGKGSAAAAGAKSASRFGALSKTIVSGATATAARASRSFVEAVDDVGDSMGNDEYLS